MKILEHQSDFSAPGASAVVIAEPGDFHALQLVPALARAGKQSDQRQKG
jgi:hypothetical protein